MTPTELYEEFKNVNHSRETRLYYAEMLQKNPKLISKALDILFMVDNKISPKAAWVLDFTFCKDLNLIIPYLDTFTKNIHKVRLDAAKRPVAKICELLALAYTSKENKDLKKALTTLHKECIVETCFDYMINDEKVATKAYAMHALFLFGKTLNWIHPELKTILERDFHKQSAAFKARARHILKKIN